MSEEATQDAGSQEVATQAVAESAAPVNFLDSLPEDLRGNPSLQNFTDAGSLAKSYVHARSMIGADNIGRPQESWTDEQWTNFYSETGRPQDTSAYVADFDNILSEEQANGFRQAVFEAGLSPKQFDKIAAYFVNENASMEQQHEERSQAAFDEGVASLRQEWGQGTEQRIKLAQNAANTLLGDIENNEFFRETMADGRQLGDHPEIIKMFAALGEQMGEDNLVGETSELIMTPEQAKQELKELMRPGTPYTDGQHPEHDAYVRKVQDLFQAAS